MPRADGGRIAARGLEYQYVSTLEAAFDRFDQPGTASIRVEGADDGSGADSVDFDVIGPDGTCLLAAQIKTSQAAAGVSAATAFEVLARLVVEADAEEYLVRYGAAPGAGGLDLHQALGAGLEPAALRTRLEQILAAAPKCLGLLRALSGGQLARLTRSCVEYDVREAHEVLLMLRERVRRFRNASAAGLGEQSAGVLAGFLVADIMRRAVGPQSELTADEFRSMVLMPGSTIARIVGSRDWGVVVGPVPIAPDVPRAELLSRVVEVFDTTGPRRVTSAVFSGLSGIGKSSLAAGYIADRADLYDWIFWVSAQSEATLRAGFGLIALQLLGADSDRVSTLSATELQSVVHTQLGRVPGRWLMVLDDAASATQITPWLPTTGNGDAIITTIDSTIRLPAAAQIALPVMLRSEATMLLATRFGLEGPELQRHAQDLHALAEGLGHWPLAMELATGYMVACGLDIRDGGAYLNNLKLRSLADEDAVPAGYPRTLAAALQLSLESLQHRAEGSEAGRLAAGMLAFTAYLACQQIPAHLLAAAVAVDLTAPDAAEIPLTAPIIVSPSELPVPEAVRELRRFSLVAPDSPLPIDETQALPLAGIDQTVSVNSIVQDLLRVMLDSEPGNLEILDRLIDHTERWHTAAMTLGDMRRAVVLFAHADRLAEHVIRLDIRTANAALLLGNTARAYEIAADFAAAERLVRAEVDILSGPEDPNPDLLHHAHLARARAYFRNSSHTLISLEEAIRSLEHVYFAATGLATELPEASVFFAGCALSLFEAYSSRGREIPDSMVGVESALRDLLTRLPETAWSQAHDQLRQGEELLDSGDADGAEPLLRAAVDSQGLDGPNALHARFRLIDALIQQNRWALARSELNYLYEQLATSPAMAESVTQLLINGGIRCALHWALTGDIQPALMLDALMSWQRPLKAGQGIEPWDVRRFDVIQAAHIATLGEVEQARLILEQITADQISGDEPAQDAAWINMRGLIFDAVDVLATLQDHPRATAPGQAPLDQGPEWWTSADFVRYRRASITFLRPHEEWPRDIAVIHTLLTLALYLESGVVENPALDLAHTMRCAFQQFGINADVRAAVAVVSDDEHGWRRQLGQTDSGWDDEEVFNGHCVLVLPESKRILDVTIEQLPEVRELGAGPVVIRQMVFNQSGGVIEGPIDPDQTEFSMQRGSVNFRYLLLGSAADGGLSTDDWRISARMGRYREAGENLAAAVSALLDRGGALSGP